MQLLFILHLAFLLVPIVSAESIKVMTFNLRYASQSKPNSWAERRPVMKECLLESAPDIIGTQEGLYEQLKDIEKDLPQYRWLGTGRDGGSNGEFMAIFYTPDRFEPMEYDHFWLSDTPQVIASTTWGNSNRRMVTWIRFLDKRDSREFYIINTHFDHQIQEAREKSAALLKERIKTFKQDLPIILLGDFNAKAGANKAYDILTEGDTLKDTWNTAKEKRGEIVATFNGFRTPIPGDNRIDWILVRNVEAEWISILTCSRNDQFPSDHFPVIAEVKLK